VVVKSQLMVLSVATLTMLSRFPVSAAPPVGASRPNSTVKPGPDTGENKPYHLADTITAFSQLGVGEVGVLGVMPRVGEVSADPAVYRSRFDRANGADGPGYYSVYLEDPKVRTDITATDNVALYRFTFPETRESHVLVDLSHPLSAFRGGEIHLADGKTIQGSGTYDAGNGAVSQVAFCIHFSKPFRRRGTWRSGEVVDNRSRVSLGEMSSLGAFVYFWTHEGETILMKVGVSTTGIDEARQRIEAEFPGWDFDEVREQSQQAWSN
jgi:putative alpha-1,2-mannosidase